MPAEVPPTIDSPKSFIGIGSRELLVLGGGLVIALSVLILPLSLAIKIFFAVLAVGLSIAVAFGRDPRTGKTLEQYLLSLISFYGRARFQQRGASISPVRIEPPLRVVTGPSKKKTQQEEQPAEPPEEDPWADLEQFRRPLQAEQRSIPAVPDRRPALALPELKADPAIKFAPLALDGTLLFSIVSVAFLCALFAWIWGGGIAELVSRYGGGF